ncbi:MAG TPA: hypothetical protein VHO90_02215, partial [Bacteroidales bacterium]|nr:hypothetical protein [Bacteroidales bacterium]
HLYTIITLLFLPYLTMSGHIKDTINKEHPAKFYSGVHFAGNMGLFSVSFGKKLFKDRFVIAAGYGYLPEAVNGTEVHSVLLKTTYNFNKKLVFKKINFYTGVNAIYGITSNTFVILPNRYPDDYYAPNAIHVAPMVGFRFPFFFYKPVWAHKVYMHTELATVDTYLWYSLSNKSVKFWDVCNLSAGIYYDL